jgi:hypothetical protein
MSGTSQIDPQGDVQLQLVVTKYSRRQPILTQLHLNINCTTLLTHKAGVPKSSTSHPLCGHRREPHSATLILIFVQLIPTQAISWLPPPIATWKLPRQWHPEQRGKKNHAVTNHRTSPTMQAGFPGSVVHRMLIINSHRRLHRMGRAQHPGLTWT